MRTRSGWGSVWKACAGSVMRRRTGWASGAPGQAASEPTPIIFTNPAETRLPTRIHLQRLGRTNRYVICDKTTVVATWRNDGMGWMIRTASGFAPARRNSESLPHYGQFVLVELEMIQKDEGMRLAAIHSYQLASRFAMTKLDKGDDDIIRGAGPMQVAVPFLPGMLGCRLRILPENVMGEEQHLSWDEALLASLSPENPWYQKYMAVAEALVVRSNVQFPVSHGAEIGPTDMHAVLRGHGLGERFHDLPQAP